MSAPGPASGEDDAEFYRIYGTWQPFTVAEVVDLMGGFPHPWWVVGGHALEAFAGVTRPHEDLDISFFADAVQDFRRQLEGRYHLWSNDGGTFRFFDDKHPEPLHPLAQVWVRENAQSPWLLDAIPTPSVDG